jgi:hypothetical protein
MRTGGKTALTVRGACLAAGLTFFLCFAHAESQLHVMISDEAVTIKADNTSIRSVLEELSRQTNLIVMSEETLDELITVEVDRSTLQGAIRRLLRQKSFMLHQLSHVSSGELPGIMPHSRLWIFSDDSGSNQHAWTIQPALRPDPVENSEMIDYQVLALSDKRADREEAMLGFGEIASSNSIEYLQQGLSDPDERVRETAIESLAELGGTESVQALSLALNDPDASLRIDVVDALGEIGGQEAIKLLQEAMTDDNDTVREAAAEWLTELAWLRN